MADQEVTQAVLASQSILDPSRTTEKFALFNPDGTPLDLSDSDSSSSEVLSIQMVLGNDAFGIGQTSPLIDTNGNGFQGTLALPPLLVDENSDVFSFLQIIGPIYSDGSFNFGNVSVLIADLTGDNVLLIQKNGPLSIDSGGTWEPTSDDDWDIGVQSGADLSLDDNGFVKSTAGGMYSVMFCIGLNVPFPTA